MKTTLTLFAVLSFTASSMAAIEYSDDQLLVVAASETVASSTEAADPRFG